MINYELDDSDLAEVEEYLESIQSDDQAAIDDNIIDEALAAEDLSDWTPIGDTKGDDGVLLI